MASLVDDFLISIGLDAKDFAKGIDKVRTDLGEVAGQASGAFEEVGDSSVKAGSVSALSFDKSAKRIDNLGEVASEAAESIESAFSGLSPVFEAVRSRVGALAATFALVAGGVETFANYIEKSDALGNLSIHQTSARTSQDVDFARFFVARFWCFERFLIQRVTKRVTKHGRMFCFDCWLFPILANCRRLKCEVLRFLLFFCISIHSGK